MRALMKEIVNWVFTFYISIDDEEFRARVDRWARLADRWDEPDSDLEFLKLLADKE